MIDAAVVLYGTFIAWLVIGLAEFDSSYDPPDWLSPPVIAAGVVTATVTVVHALRVARGRRRNGALAWSAAAIHVGLAVSTMIALGSLAGACVLLAGAVLIAATTARPSPEAAR